MTKVTELVSNELGQALIPSIGMQVRIRDQGLLDEKQKSNHTR